MSIEACEFWFTFAEDADLAGRARPPRLRGLHLLWLEGDAEETRTSICPTTAALSAGCAGRLPQSNPPQGHPTHPDSAPHRNQCPPPLTPAPTDASRAAPPSLASAQERDGSHEAENPLVCSITCWMLGRDAFIEEHKNQSLRVQEAEAFATLEGDAGLGLAPYFELVLQNLVVAFDKYQHNMSILYDPVGTLDPSSSAATSSTSRCSTTKPYSRTPTWRNRTGPSSSSRSACSQPHAVRARRGAVAAHQLQLLTVCLKYPRRPCASLVQVLGAPADRAADPDSVAPQDSQPAQERGSVGWARWAHAPGHCPAAPARVSVGLVTGRYSCARPIYGRSTGSVFTFSSSPPTEDQNPLSAALPLYIGFSHALLERATRKWPSRSITTLDAGTGEDPIPKMDITGLPVLIARGVDALTFLPLSLYDPPEGRMATAESGAGAEVLEEYMSMRQASGSVEFDGDDAEGSTLASDEDDDGHLTPNLD
ncbi:hypothetical protein B0H13DRAFT_1904306 [Mycena leptocephala]|nr:hypothetical protein B0H13DRAFT_1904306 [Mycena leptocephala]